MTAIKKQLVPLSKFLKQIDPLIQFVGAIGAVMVFLFTTFAMVRDVEKVRADTITYVDMKHAEVTATLREIKESVKVTEERVYELHKERGIQYGRKRRY